MENEQIDKSVVNLMKALKQHESGGDYKKKGGSGEYGAYQYTEPTFKGYATQYAKMPNARLDNPEDQDKVTYYTIKGMKDKGYTPEQVLSEWNSGKKDAYLSDHKGTNKYGVKFDTPKYVETIKNIALKQTQQAEASAIPPTPEQPEKSLISKTGSFLEKGIRSIFPGEKIGEAIGTLGGLGLEKVKGLMGGQDNSKYYDTSAPSPLQVAGDATQAALTVIPGMPGKSIRVAKRAVPLLQPANSTLGRIGRTGLLGAGFGTSNAVSEGKTDLGEIAKQGLIGGAIGGALGGIGEGVNKIAEVLPRRMARSFIKSPANEEAVDYAIKRGLGSPQKMVQESNESIKTLGKQLGDILRDPKYDNLSIDGKTMLKNIATKFPDSGLSHVDIVSNLEKVAPLKKNLIGKLLKGKITLKELHSLNSEIGSNIYKTAFDEPAMKAGKDVGNATYHLIGDFIKKTAPGTREIMEDLSKEYPLNSALNRLINREGKSQILTLADIMATLGGMTINPVAGATALVGKKILTSPTSSLRTAGLINKLGLKTSRGLRAGLLPLALKKINDVSD